jgi:hypothetical protein
MANDGTALGSNPAGLALDEAIVLSSFLARDYGAVSYGAVAASFPYGGVQLSQIDSGPIATPDGALRYIARSLVGGAAAGFGPVAVGVRGKLYWLSNPATASGWAVDPGILVVTEWLRVGIVLENAWSRAVRFADGHDEPWMRSLTFAVAMSVEAVSDVWWTAMVEGRDLFARRPARLAAGTEVWIGPLALRAGFDGTSPTFGLGIQFSRYALDWAYGAHADLGGGHRLSLTFRF